jgi:hypothetical protein
MRERTLRSGTEKGGILLGIVIWANRVVFGAFVLAGGLLAAGMGAVAWVPPLAELGHHAVGGASLLGLLPLAAGPVAAGAAMGLYFAGRMDPFWTTVAPVNLGFLCLSAAAFSMPPPPPWGAAVAAVLGAGCVALLVRRGAAPRRCGLPALLGLALLGLVPPLAFWAPLAAGGVFLGVWGVARWGGRRTAAV